MPHSLKFSPLPLTAEETRFFEDLSRSRSGSILRVRRAAMLLEYVNGTPISEIGRHFRCDATVVERNIDKALRQEVLSVRKRDGRKRDLRAVTEEMAGWVYELSCQNPRNLGYSCVEWPPSLLAQHVRDHCRAAGHHALAKLSGAEVSRILEGTRNAPIKNFMVQSEVVAPTARETVTAHA